MFASHLRWTCALALFSLSITGCDPSGPSAADAGPDAEPPAADGGDQTSPEILSVALTETPVNVLAYTLEVRTDEPATIAAQIDGPGGAFTVESAELAESTTLWIGGLRPESDYDVTITATDAAGNATTDTTQTIETRALPDGFPPVQVRTAATGASAPGYTLFGVFRWPAGENQPESGRSWLLALDASGAVVWYHPIEGLVEDARVLDGGHVLYNADHTAMVEIDRQGAIVRRYAATGAGHAAPEGAIALDIDSIHHETAVLPNGNFLVMSTERRTITPAQCPSYTGDLEVVGDVIVELDPSGAIVAQVSTFDDLDPCRRTDRGFEGGFWNAHYGATTQDWTHGNAAFYAADEGLVITSLRHSDWLVAYRWEPGGGGATGELAWILGEEGDIASSGDPFAWFYHQHAPEVTSAGTLLLFDNGNLRPGTNFDPDDGEDDLPYSRAVEYALDTSAADPSGWTVEQVWEWILPDRAYAPFVGDANELSNGNVLIAFGGIVDPPTEAIGNPAHRKSARIVEVTRGSGASEVVFEVEVIDEAADDFDGYTVYRAVRAPESFLR